MLNKIALFYVVCYYLYGDNMKKVLGLIKGLLIGLWALVAILTTICLIAKNSYGVSVFGDYSLFNVDNKSLEPDFRKFDIVVTEKGYEDQYKVGDKVFFIMNNKETRSYINYGVIEDIDVNKGAQDTFYFSAGAVSFDDIMGKANGSIVWHRYGAILALFESRWGFMFLIILPALYATVYEVYVISQEVKRNIRRDLKKEMKKESNEEE